MDRASTRCPLVEDLSELGLLLVRQGSSCHDAQCRLHRISVRGDQSLDANADLLRNSHESDEARLPIAAHVPAYRRASDPDPSSECRTAGTAQVAKLSSRSVRRSRTSRPTWTCSGTSPCRSTATDDDTAMLGDELNGRHSREHTQHADDQEQPAKETRTGCPRHLPTNLVVVGSSLLISPILGFAGLGAMGVAFAGASRRTAAQGRRSEAFADSRRTRGLSDPW